MLKKKGHVVYYLRGSLIWMYRSSEMAHKFSIDDVEHITSNAIQVSQNSAPNIQYPARGHK